MKQTRRVKRSRICWKKPTRASKPSGFWRKEPMPNVSRDIVVSNSLGLHARPAMQFVDTANQFKSQVMVIKGGEEPYEADGKSVMQMIILAATEGTTLQIRAEGDDAEQAVSTLAKLFEDKIRRRVSSRKWRSKKASEFLRGGDQHGGRAGRRRTSSFPSGR